MTVSDAANNPDTPPIDGLDFILPERLDTDAGHVERDLFRLVLSIIELLRQLMERQALRRVDTGELDDEQTEEIGLALMRLEAAMAELRGRYDLAPEDLDLDLGPLGSLLGEASR